MPERSEWCYKVNRLCSCYPGYSRCRLDESIAREYRGSRKAKQQERQRIAELAEEDPEQVARLCLRVDY